MSAAKSSAIAGVGKCIAYGSGIALGALLLHFLCLSLLSSTTKGTVIRAEAGRVTVLYRLANGEPMEYSVSTADLSSVPQVGDPITVHYNFGKYARVIGVRLEREKYWFASHLRWGAVALVLLVFGVVLRRLAHVSPKLAQRWQNARRS